MKIRNLALPLLLIFSGCYHAKDFKGKAVELRTDDFYSVIEPVRIGVEESIPDKIGYDNNNLNATGMKLLYSSKRKESEIKISNLKAFYQLNESESKEMEIPYHGLYGPEPKTAFQAYLIPSEDIGPPEKEYDFASIRTRAVTKGRYKVTVYFEEDGEERELNFDFIYSDRSYYQAPDFNVSGK